MKLSDILIEVKPLTVSDSLGKAASFLLSEDIDVIPVVDRDQKFVGAVTDRTFLELLPRGLDPLQAVGPYLNTDISRLSNDDELEEISLDAVPAVVFRKDGSLAGVITRRLFAEALQAASGETTQTGSTGPSEELKSLKGWTRYLNAIFNSSDDGIWITDGSGKVLAINLACEQITGLKAQDLVGKSMHELVKTGLFDHSAVLLAIEKRQSVTIQQTVKGKVKYLTTGNPIMDERGNLFCVVAKIRNIAKLVSLQDQLLKQKEQSRKYKDELAYLRALRIKESALVFRSASMRQVVETASRIAGVDSTVLITGESGTGKDVLARHIHSQDKGSDRPFITINCGAIPEQLLESELFGYEGGAFTGARKEGKVGMFELAHKGTLFLDEVGELPLGLQVMILQAIQNRKIYRVGGTKPIPVSVRIITATNRDLTAMMKEKKFREDLYYRLMVIPIHIPPLRTRKEDIPLLVRHFIDEFNHHFGMEKTLSPQTLECLVQYDWPGNVRELRNIIERMVVMSHGQEITVDDLPETLRTKKAFSGSSTHLKDAVATTERLLLSETYKQCGSWPKVAEILGVNFTTVYRKASRYGLLHR
jgi:PAS domain S-box-containing protein